ncbi:fusion protein(transaldolase and 6-phosphogluconate dehydrogenase) (plasmid) [Phenylobacterium zucineum HLK1]|uniref:Transaldolase n=2 Tax=Phenylobacterium TaxID=20 RepID=B4RIF1_PHEZH|nr:decarboxylating 6-phosphogluconate dehydrogenase [Phenylobacterium zucineum]ACG80126.1 fusion protein(transaldolase and 6-phosphogluconate dehydrogenase) [Phenylobacterium zucineum HLK1]
MSNPLQDLARLGQAIWLDRLDRPLLESGDLARLIAEDAVTGVTTNPAIFQQAFAGDAEDRRIAALLETGDAEPVALYEQLAVADVQLAADLLRPTYDRLGGGDGYVSLEVSPRLAFDVDATINEARRLWRAVDRPNLMIKVPGTSPGLSAVRQLIAEGINVNVTLLFSVDQYLAAVAAHLAGLEDRLQAGGDLQGVHGVASVFVSRIDSRIDAEIDRRLKVCEGDTAAALRRLRGKVAIANARIAYRRHLEVLEQPRWQALAKAGAAPQRLLWGSTGVKDPAYSDVLYVESLIGPGTVDTMPLQTLEAFRDHGQAHSRLLEHPSESYDVLTSADAYGLNVDAACKALLLDGVERFTAAFDGLLQALAEKRRRILGAPQPPPSPAQASAPAGPHLGMVGLGRMGANMVRRLQGHDQACIIYDQDPQRTAILSAEGAPAAESLSHLVQQLSAPRVVWLMLPAGAPTETTIAELAKLLAPGDVIVDGGNGYYRDAIRRGSQLAAKGFRFLDVGVAGGLAGLSRGYSLMIGGEAAVVAELDPVFQALAPGEPPTPESLPPAAGRDPRPARGYVHAGPVGAGHFVKMVHNGIEYGLMQAFAEGFSVLRGRDSDALPESERYAFDLAEIAQAWRRGSIVSSGLLDLAAEVLAQDSALDSYVGAVSDGGEARWLIGAALDQEEPIQVLAAALYARFRSRTPHTFGDKLISALRAAFGGHVEAGDAALSRTARVSAS